MIAPRHLSPLLLAAALLGWPAASPAKGLWNKSCDKQGCATEQVIHADSSHALTLRVRFSPDTQPDQAKIHLGAPQGVLLPKGISLSVDGSKSIVLPYLRCQADECGAEAVLNFDALAKFLQGKVMTVHYAYTPEQGVDVQVRLDGLDPALQSLARKP